MTFSIVARCADTGQVGIGMATASPSVGSRCVFGAQGVGAIAFQAVGDPRLGKLGMDLLKLGFSAQKVLAALKDNDPFIELRQIGIVDSQGHVAVHTGAKNGDYAGHVVGDGFVALGNYLDGPAVTAGIADAFKQSKGRKFEERLMLAVEAGRDAGGQGPQVGQTSSALLVYDKLPFAYVDLRVDHSMEPIAELRRILDWHKPYLDYYVERASNPEILIHREWIKQQGIPREYGIPQPKKI